MTTSMTATVTRRVVPKDRMRRYLAALLARPGATARTAYVAPWSAPPPLAELSPSFAGAEGLDRVTSAIEASDVGVALFWDGRLLRAVLPPLPLAVEMETEGIDATPLLALLDTEPVIAACLVRLGRYGIGVYQGERLLASKTDRRFVKGRHKKGGSSSNRFRRIREGQMHELYKDVCETLQDRLGPYERDIEHFFLGGEAHTLAGFRDWCPWAERFGSVARKRLLDVREPGHDALVALPKTLWESVVYEMAPPL
ncbi:MAG: Vms1/Ankzf1 family peptidyl-tRNA hydrolase [Chloroflexota bacterium]|nr:Vms1/Ankzf1 family peptidyl-tRNA hydrolase [Chloroflexota bacterium]